MTARLDPRLRCSGNAREAVEFYRCVLGGRLDVMTSGDVGGGGDQHPDDGVMHAALRTDGGLELMGSDGHDRDVAGSGRVSIARSGDDAAALTRWFEALTEGGAVDVPLAPQGWGDTFGQGTDRFGPRWLVDTGMSPA